MINTDHEKTNILLENKIKNFSENINVKLIYQRYSEHLYEILLFNEEIKDKYADIYWWNKKIFTGDVFVISYIDVFDDIKKDLNNKDLNFYDEKDNQICNSILVHYINNHELPKRNSKKQGLFEKFFFFFSK